MADTEEGQPLSVVGPLGHGFTVPQGEGENILVGGGIGVAPLFFLSQHLTIKQIPFSFMAGFGTDQDIVMPEDLELPPMDITLATDDGSSGFRGVVSDLLTEHLDRDRGRDVSRSFFTCGPVPMLRKVSAVASKYHADCQVSLEAHMACGFGACLGCAIPVAQVDETSVQADMKSVNADIKSVNADGTYRHVCKDGPVFQAQAVDWDSL
jgi:dihydroorotate dehydrogenase electron transfer subunit